MGKGPKHTFLQGKQLRRWAGKILYSQECILIFQRTRIGFPAPTLSCSQPHYKSSCKGFSTLFCHLHKWDIPTHNFHKEIKINNKSKNKSRKCGSRCLVINEIQINTITRYHLIFLKMTMIKQTKDNTCGQGCAKFHVGRNVIKCSHYEKKF